MEGKQSWETGFPITAGIKETTDILSFGYIFTKYSRQISVQGTVDLHVWPYIMPIVRCSHTVLCFKFNRVVYFWVVLSKNNPKADKKLGILPPWVPQPWTCLEFEAIGINVGPYSINTNSPIFIKISSQLYTLSLHGFRHLFYLASIWPTVAKIFEVKPVYRISIYTVGPVLYRNLGLTMIIPHVKPGH